MKLYLKAKFNSTRFYFKNCVQMTMYYTTLNFQPVNKGNITQKSAKTKSKDFYPNRHLL